MTKLLNIKFFRKIQDDHFKINQYVLINCHRLCLKDIKTSLNDILYVILMLYFNDFSHNLIKLYTISHFILKTRNENTLISVYSLTRFNITQFYTIIINIFFILIIFIFYYKKDKNPEKTALKVHLQ